MRDNSFAMRIKTIISTAAFIIAFVFSTALASLFIDTSSASYQTDSIVIPNYNRSHTSCFKNRGNNTARKIESLLKEDDRYGRTLDRKLFQIDKGLLSPFSSSSYSEYADSVSEYAESSGKMSADDLPYEFQNAWREHMKAWHDYAEFLDGMKNSSARTESNGEKLSAFDNEYNAEINRTWYEVLRVANDYGADFH
jgi:hypothetical protein